MQILPGKLGPRQVRAESGPSETGENADAVRVLEIRAFLIIENRLLRDALAHLLRRQGDIELSGQGGSVETTPEEVAKSGCDVALLDFLDPEWISAVREQGHKTGRAIKTIVIGMDSERSSLLEAARCGVTGYLLKSASATDLAAAVRAVARGEASSPANVYDAVSDGGENRGEQTGEETDGQNGTQAPTARVDEATGERFYG